MQTLPPNISDRSRSKQPQGKCTSSVPKKVFTITDLSKQCLRDFIKTQACSTVSPVVPITIKVINPIVSNVVQNDSPVWGSLSSADLHQIVNAVYDEIVYWRKNLFMLPSGSAGKEYVCEATRLIHIWNANATDIHSGMFKTEILVLERW